MRVTDGGRAPRAVVDVPAVGPLPAGRAADAAGPLPMDHVQLPREHGEATIEEQPAPGDNADVEGADEGEDANAYGDDVADGDDADGEDDADSEDGADGNGGADGDGADGNDGDDGDGAAREATTRWTERLPRDATDEQKRDFERRKVEHKRLNAAIRQRNMTRKRRAAKRPGQPYLPTMRRKMRKQ